MKDLFYFTITAILWFSISVLYNYLEDVDNCIYTKQSIHENCIVIDKYESYLRGNVMTFKTQNDSIVQHRVYDIFYNKYKVGDIVK
jgi:hypothetical protein